MAESVYYPIFPKVGTVGTNSDQKTLTVAIPEDTPESYTITFPPANSVGYLHNDGTGATAWQDVATGDPSSATLEDGTATDPSLKYINEPNTGFYRKGTGTIGITGLGADMMTISPAFTQFKESVSIAAGSTEGALDTSGQTLDVAAHTMTDVASSGAVAKAYFNRIAQPTLAAENAISVVDAATLFVESSPAAGANVSITNAYGLLVGAASKFTGDVEITGNLVIGGSTSISGTAGFKGQYEEVDITGSSAYSIDTAQDVVVFTSDAGTKTISMPAITTQLRGKMFLLVKATADGLLQVVPDGADTIDGLGSVDLAEQNDRVQLMATTGRWVSV